MIEIAIVCGTVAFLKVNESNNPVNNKTSNVSINVTVDHIVSEDVQQLP